MQRGIILYLVRSFCRGVGFRILYRDDHSIVGFCLTIAAFVAEERIRIDQRFAAEPAEFPLTRCRYLNRRLCGRCRRFRKRFRLSRYRLLCGSTFEITDRLRPECIDFNSRARGGRDANYTGLPR